MSVEKLVELKVVIVLSEGVVEGLGNPEPAKDEEEAERHEDWVVEVDLFIFPLEVLVSRNDPLLSEEGGGKIDIDCQVDNLFKFKFSQPFKFRFKFGKIRSVITFTWVYTRGTGMWP